MLAEQPAVQSRTLEFAYFGGGTPSYLSSKQLRSLHEKLTKSLSWHTAKEVTFECEPGTLKESKLQTIKNIGVTRLSLGVEYGPPDATRASAGGRRSPSPGPHRHRRN